MQKAQHETGKVLNIGVVNRFNDSVNLIKEYHRRAASSARCSTSTSASAPTAPSPGWAARLPPRRSPAAARSSTGACIILDIVMYCCGDPKPVTVTGEAFCKLGRDMKNYAYKSMWAETAKNVDGTYDVDDSVTAPDPHRGPGHHRQRRVGAEHRRGRDVHRLHGRQGRHPPAVRQRLHGLHRRTRRAGGVQAASSRCATHFENEINAFVDCVKTGKKLPSHIDTVIITAQDDAGDLRFRRIPQGNRPAGLIRKRGWPYAENRFYRLLSR